MITVCVPTYNGEKFIEKTIRSLLQQDYKDVEIIVIDDCSKDETICKIHALMKEDDRIRLIKNEKNMGFCKNVNICLKEARGEFFLVMGQDDILESNHLTEMIKHFSTDTVIVYCDYVLIDDKDNVFDTNSHCQQKNVKAIDLKKSNIIPSCGLIMRTESLKNVGGYPELPRFPNYGEYHTWIRMAENGLIKFNNSVKAKYRRHDNNMTNDFDNKLVKIKLESYFNECRKQLLHSKKLTFIDKWFIRLYMIYRFTRVRML